MAGTSPAMTMGGTARESIIREVGITRAHDRDVIQSVRIDRLRRIMPPCEFRFAGIAQKLSGWTQDYGKLPWVDIEARDRLRFLAATRQAEILGAAVLETVRNTLPREIEYLRGYDVAKGRIQNFLEMPEHRFDLTMGFLRQNGIHFSKWARENESSALTDDEVTAIETIYANLLHDQG